MRSLPYTLLANSTLVLAVGHIHKARVFLNPHYSYAFLVGGMP